MQDWGFDSIERSRRIQAVKQKCPKCGQMAIIEVKNVIHTELTTKRVKRCVNCGKTWGTKENLID